MALTQVNTKGITDATVATADLANDAVTAAKIADEAVDEARIQISNAGTNGQYLQKQSGNTGGLTWADVPAGVGGATGVDFNDTVKARFGTGNDFEIYFDGSNSYIKEPAAVAGQLIIDGWNGVDIRQGETGENMIRALGGGAVELYHNNGKKFETTSGGIKVYTALQLDDGYKIHFGTDEDLEITHDGVNGEIKNKTGYLGLYAKTGEMGVKIVPDAQVELYYDNSLKFKTNNAGAIYYGTLNTGDDGKATYGAGDDLQIFHDGSNSYIADEGTGSLLIRGDGLQLQRPNGNTYVKCVAGGTVELYHDNAKKAETVTGGFKVTGNISFDSNNSGLYLGGSGGSNQLNDYEEGTFTPVVTGNGGTPGTWSTDNHAGTYRKIGKLCFIAMQVSGVVSAAGNGYLQITGLPFTSASATGGHGQALALGPLFNWDVHGDAFQIGSRVNDSGTTVMFWNNFDNASDTMLNWPFGSSGTKYGSITGCYACT